MPKFILAPCVESGLWAIWKFIAQDNPDAARRVIEAAHATFKNLAVTPGLGRPHKFRNPQLKALVITHIFFCLPLDLLPHTSKSIAASLARWFANPVRHRSFVR